MLTSFVTPRWHACGPRRPVLTSFVNPRRPACGPRRPALTSSVTPRRPACSGERAADHQPRPREEPGRGDGARHEEGLHRQHPRRPHREDARRQGAEGDHEDGRGLGEDQGASIVLSEARATDIVCKKRRRRNYRNDLFSVQSYNIRLELTRDRLRSFVRFCSILFVRFRQLRLGSNVLLPHFSRRVLYRRLCSLRKSVM